MKRSISIFIASAFAGLFLVTASASADVGGQFQFAGLQAPESENVDGFRFSILYGKNTKVGGFDLGFFAYTRAAEFDGFGPLFAIGHVTGNSSGCMCSFANFVEGTASGANIGFINIVGDSPDAVNVGFVNTSQKTTGVDIGGLSMSKKSSTQVGFLNITEEITNVQIGLLNVASNGFFPVFPFFNYPKSK